MLFSQAEELEDVVILERQEVALLGLGGQAFFGIAFDRDVTQKESRVDLSAEFADRPALASGHGQVEIAFIRAFAGGQNHSMLRPTQ